MRIGENQIEEIIITTNDGTLIATITDENTICDKEYKVILRG